MYFCVKVEENGVYSEVKYGSTCNSDSSSQNGQILDIGQDLGENFRFNNTKSKMEIKI